MGICLTKKMVFKEARRVSFHLLKVLNPWTSLQEKAALCFSDMASERIASITWELKCLAMRQNTFFGSMCCMKSVVDIAQYSQRQAMNVNDHAVASPTLFRMLLWQTI